LLKFGTEVGLAQKGGGGGVIHLFIANGVTFILIRLKSESNENLPQQLYHVDTTFAAAQITSRGAISTSDEKPPLEEKGGTHIRALLG
jgi:hypothetical protein